ncbi:MAG: tetratricopeptide repeat protein, partial [Syntrophales bacterium]|nr:tetratricopeptide repeat protein [Syntrophales bacterium]
MTGFEQEMEYYKKKKEKNKRALSWRVILDRLPSRRRLIIAGCAIAAVVLAAGAWLLLQSGTKTGKGVREAVLTLIAGRTPSLDYVLVEKNGKDQRLAAGDTLEIGYRDEFVIKDVRTGSPFEAGISVRVRGLEGKETYRVVLKGIEMVDRVMAFESSRARGATRPEFAIQVLFREKAMAEIPVAVEIGPQDWLRAAKESSSGTRSIDPLKRAVEMNTQDTSVRKMLASAYTEQGHKEKAISEYRKVLRQKPDDMPALIGLAGLLTEKKQYEEALPLYNLILKKNPSDAA